MITDTQFADLLTSLGERREVQKQSAFERHAQTVLAALIALVIAWVGVSIWDVKEKQSLMYTEQQVTTVKIIALTSKVENIEHPVSVVDYVQFKQRTLNRLEELESKVQ